MRHIGALTVATRGDREIVMTRRFDAPRDLVFRAMTTPGLLKQWFSGPPGWSLEVCTVDLWAGGQYRYVWRGPDGFVMGMGGTFLEVKPPEKVVQTERFDDAWYPGEAIGTMTLEEVEGRTHLTLSVVYQSAEALEAVLKTPMEQGVSAGYDRLAELLAQPEI